MNIINFKAILKGLLGALIVSFLLSILVTLLLHFTPLTEALLPSFATLIFFLSILLGSLISAKSAKSKGLIHGLGVGVIYLSCTIIIGFFVATDSFSWLMFAKKIVYTLVGGSLGGIIGIGLSHN